MTRGSLNIKLVEKSLDLFTDDVLQSADLSHGTDSGNPRKQHALEAIEEIPEDDDETQLNDVVKPCPTNSYRSIHVFLSQPFATSRSRSTLSVGSRATLRHVPIVLIPQALVVVSHTETVSAIPDTSLSATLS